MYHETDRSHHNSQEVIMPSAKLAAKSGRGRATRQRIIERSASVFNKHGYAGTSMAELMAATGLEKGGLYRHFKSKQMLAAAAFDYAWETVRAPRQRGLDDCNSYVGKLLLFVRNFVEEEPPRLSGGCPLLNTAVDSDDGNAVMRGRVRAALDQWRSTLSGFVRNGQAEGELRGEIDPDTVAVIMISILEGAVMMSRLEKSREPLRKVGEHLESYLRAMKG
jgi:TetR/AcrR family transcriptional regulator, transcriptional repressor for nem operon